MATPRQPDEDSREQLLAVLSELVAEGGPAPLLAPPVEPSAAAFPEAWSPDRAGVSLLLRRLAWHAGLPCEIVVEDELAGAPPTERKPATIVELLEIRPADRAGAGRPQAVFVLAFVGSDDIAGTLAHEIGVAYAVLERPEPQAPYRSTERSAIAVDDEHDLVRGAIATVYLGLGVLAANAAFQQYSRGGRLTAYLSLEYDVLQAGELPMSALAYLLAVQAIVRGESTAPPGLKPPQRDEVSAWLAALRGQREALRARLGIAADASGAVRPAVVRFD